MYISYLTYTYLDSDNLDLTQFAESCKRGTP